MPDPTLTDIFTAIRKHSPGRVPESLHPHDGRVCIIKSDGVGEYVSNWYETIPDDIARHVLGFAMVMDYFDGYSISRCPNLSGWEVRLDFDEMADGGIAWEWDGFADEDHSNDPLLSLFEAWKWAKGIT